MPILAPGTVEFMSRSAEQTQRLGVRLGQLLMPGDAICLGGDLGAGKTTFTSGIGQGWGSTQPVTSPTYVIVHKHQRSENQDLLYHLDAYRITSAGDAESIGLEDILDSRSTVIIEWAENIREFLPADRLWITFEADAEQEWLRRLVFAAEGTRAQELLESFKKAAFGGA